jgi:hypothetical protein
MPVNVKWWNEHFATQTRSIGLSEDEGERVLLRSPPPSETPVPPSESAKAVQKRYGIAAHIRPINAVSFSPARRGSESLNFPWPTVTRRLTTC